MQDYPSIVHQCEHSQAHSPIYHAEQLVHSMGVLQSKRNVACHSQHSPLQLNLLHQVLRYGVLHCQPWTQQDLKIKHIMYIHVQL